LQPQEKLETQQAAARGAVGVPLAQNKAHL
jgi:hypothetical protein